MSTASEQIAAKRPRREGVTFILAVACGVLAADIYYAQPLVALISHSLGIPERLSGLVVTLTQLGYGLGLILVVPLGDILENRRLILSLISLSVLALGATAVVSTMSLFFMTAFLTGLGAVAVQVLVPYAAHMADEANRGRAVGNVMSGLMFGIMLARPVASVIANYTAWQGVFVIAAGMLIILSFVLRVKLPERRPQSQIGYTFLLRSIVTIATSTPILQRRALYHAAMFGSFSLFWTVTPLLLSSKTFGLTQGGIALFALAGAASVIASPIAGRLADRGLTRTFTGIALLSGMLTFIICLVLPLGSSYSIGILVAAALLLDLAVTTNLVLGQREIFLLDAAIRSRLNGIYMATFFMGGALGSALGGWAYAVDGWHSAALIGLSATSLAFLFYLTEFRRR